MRYASVEREISDDEVRQLLQRAVDICKEEVFPTLEELIADRFRKNEG